MLAMVWKNFDGKPYNRAELAAHINSLDFSRWRRKDGSLSRPKFITLHNTSEPTLDLWLSWAPAKRQQYIRNVQEYYENTLGWRGGPHWFVPPDETIVAFGFNDPTTCGTHCSCFNSDSIGIEMVGEYNLSPFHIGPGALVRDNAVYLMALLHRKIGISPDTLRFHIECKADNHDCPGKHVDKADVIARIKLEMAALAGLSSPTPPAPPAAAVTPLPGASGRRFTNIIATVFGGPDDDETPAYADVDDDWESRPTVALPYRFHGKRPKVRVFKDNRSVVCEIVDIGPWNTNDPYWDKSSRPQAESGKDMKGRKTNKAGIDLSPAAAEALGIDGKGIVDWEFVT